jgi:DNA polymerase I-like protein with 3'-5' exonuclease and polymerase domains
MVHQEKRAEIREKLIAEEQAARVVLQDAVRIDGFKCAPDDLRALIFKAHETETIKRFSLPTPADPDMLTEKGECAVNRQALLSLLVDPSVPDDLKAIIDLYWAVMKPIKYRTTFVESDLVEQAIGTDGRLRPGWNSCGTDTGRFSCSQPNIMNIKQHIRHMYCAGPGNVLVHGDFSSLEMRVMAYVAEDTTLEEMILGGDIYVASAKNYFKQLKPHMTKCKCETKICTDPENHVPNALRQAAKIIQLASQYAASTPTAYRQAIAQDRKMKYVMVRELQKKWKQVFHRTVSYWEEEMERVRLLGYSESRIMNRRRTYPREPRINEVVNYPIQSTAADIANLALIELDAQLKKNVPSAKIIIQLHDAFDVECPKRHEGVVKRIMGDVMSTPRTLLGLQRAFPAEIKASESWGDL